MTHNTAQEVVKNSVKFPCATKRTCRVQVASYPGLHSQLFFTAVGKKGSTAVKRREGRPGYEARLKAGSTGICICKVKVSLASHLHLLQDVQL